MKATWFVVILIAASLGGCAGGGGVENPNLLAPKLVIQPRPDGSLTVFVHGAFREQVYDWIRVSVDNTTASNRSFVFSSEEIVQASGFFVEVETHLGLQSYVMRARVDTDAAGERLLVSFLEADDWADVRPYTLPFEYVLDRPKVVA